MEREKERERDRQTDKQTDRSSEDKRGRKTRIISKKRRHVVTEED